MDFCPDQDRIAAFLSSSSLIAKNSPDVTQQTQEDAERWKDKGVLLKGDGMKVYHALLFPKSWGSRLGEQHHGEFPGFSFFLYTKLQGGRDIINLETQQAKTKKTHFPQFFSL